MPQVLGILGAGQLGRMLALAAAPLGVRCICYDPQADSCAGDVAERVTARWDDSRALALFAQRCDAITFEFENVPVQTLSEVARYRRVEPSVLTLETGQDRLLEKQLFARMGLDLHPFAPASTLAEFREACIRIGFGPANAGNPGIVAKTRRGGYDGKGQVVIRELAGIDAAWQTLSNNSTGNPIAHEVLVEQRVAFECEVSLIGVRGRVGSFGAYPLTQNRHERGMLRESIAPAPLASVPVGVAHRTILYMHALMDALQYVGVLAIEFFLVRDPGAPDGVRLLANEMAPRVHNSGHWTMDGACTSQFENHVRAVLGLPLGSCDMRPGTKSLMVNFIGSMPEASDVLAIPHVHLHDYAKPGRRGRKVGHATIVAPQIDDAHALQLIELARRSDT